VAAAAYEGVAMSRRLTLTFDNGPSPGNTEAILDVLERYGVRATFFVVGNELAKPGARELAARANAQGHWIGNHTMTHGAPLGTTEDPARAETEIAAAQRAVGDLAHPDNLFRPNGDGRLGRHLLSRAAVDLLLAGGYTVVTWNNVPGDWIEPRAEWVERALATLDAQPWSVVVLHDFLLGPMIETLPRFLDSVSARGVEIVQDFPAECTPIVRGRATAGLAAVSPAA
jgi:peptidoglycan/xylan/chitin deacetylase (PgdA/CDA1 family)